MLFFGGVGLVLVMVSVLSDRHGMRLYSAEGHSDRLLPNLVKSARMIIAIYTGYILSGTFLYMVFGMDWFDALNHSIAALSTGGFSTRAESIGYYNSAAIEAVTIVLMLLGCTNFLAHLYLIRGKFGNFFSILRGEVPALCLRPVYAGVGGVSGSRRICGRGGAGASGRHFPGCHGVDHHGISDSSQFCRLEQPADSADDASHADRRRHRIHCGRNQTDQGLHCVKKSLLESEGANHPETHDTRGRPAQTGRV